MSILFRNFYQNLIEDFTSRTNVLIHAMFAKESKKAKTTLQKRLKRFKKEKDIIKHKEC